MKVIDLLNKIANGEEVPEKISWFDKWRKEKLTYTFDKINQDYECVENYTYLFNENFMTESLTDEIEIIEEEKEIEEVLDINLLGQCDNWLQKRDVNIKSDFELNPYILEAINDNFKLLYHKQCELIKAVNELKKGK